MPPRRAWVRERRTTKPAKVDPTVALLPVLNYLGCRQKIKPAPRRIKEASPEFEAIEIVTPKKQQQEQQHHHHHQSSNHDQFAQEQPIRYQYNHHQELRSRPPARPAQIKTAARSTAVHEAVSRPHQAATRYSPPSSGEMRRHAGVHASVRASPHMSRAMAVNLDAITPLAM